MRCGFSGPCRRNRSQIDHSIREVAIGIYLFRTREPELRAEEERPLLPRLAEEDRPAVLRPEEEERPIDREEEREGAERLETEGREEREGAERREAEGREEEGRLRMAEDEERVRDGGLLRILELLREGPGGRTARTRLCEPEVDRWVRALDRWVEG